MAAASPSYPQTEQRERLSMLFAEHHRRILTVAYRITGSMADAEDVAQAVFLRLANGDRLEVANPASFLYRASINGALDLLRKRKTARSEPIDQAHGIAAAGWGSAPEADLASRQLAACLRSAIGELAPRVAEMFTLRYIEELDNGEIAALMGTSKAVIAVTLHQARSRLKKRLAELQEEKR